MSRTCRRARRRFARRLELAALQMVQMHLLRRRRGRTCRRRRFSGGSRDDAARCNDRLLVCRRRCRRAGKIGIHVIVIRVLDASIDETSHDDTQHNDDDNDNCRARDDAAVDVERCVRLLLRR